MKFEEIKQHLINGVDFTRKGWKDRTIYFEDGKLKTYTMGKSVTWYPTAEELFADDWEVYLPPILMTQFEYDLLNSFDKAYDNNRSKTFWDFIILDNMKSLGYFKHVDPCLSISVICNNAIINDTENDTSR